MPAVGAVDLSFSQGVRPMRSTFVRRGLPLLAIGLAWTLLAGAARADPPNTPAAIKKALDQKITLDFQTQDFNEAIEHLRQKTKINFVIDNRYMLLPPGLGPGGLPMQINLKSDNGKVRTALQGMLSQFGLTYVILGESVLITTEEIAAQRQMGQRVTVDAKDTPLSAVLKQLAEDTATNLVIDPRQAAKAKAKVTLQLEDVTLETAVRLLTEVADLNSVRVGNVLFITSDERADKLRKENPPNPPNPLDPLMPRFGLAGIGGGMPGFGVPPGGGFGGGGFRVPQVVPPDPKPLPGVIEPPPPKKSEEKKAINEIRKGEQSLDVVQIDPPTDVEKLKAELKEKDALVKKLRIQLEQAALALEQAKKEATRLQVELEFAQTVIEKHEKSIVKLLQEIVGQTNAAQAAKAERDAALARVKLLEIHIMEQSKKLQPPANPLPAEANNPTYKNPPPIFLEGTIEAADKTLVKIDLGQDQGVYKNNTLEVYRLKPEPKYLGRILIINADFRHSMGRLVVQPGMPAPELMVGDLVATKLTVPGLLNQQKEKDLQTKKLIEKSPPDIGDSKDPNYNNPPATSVEGSIESVEKGLVKINLGTDQGVKKDHTLEVYRLKPQVKYLGRIRIIEADARHSVARLIAQPGVPTPTLMPGDEVASKLNKF
jgi:hypothetical protein